MFKQEILFKAGDGGYFSYRIPVLGASNKGTLLTFAEARIGTASDYAAIDLVYKRRERDGEWSRPIKLVGDGKRTYHNPGLIFDGDRIHLFYGIDYMQIFHRVSYDDGKTFVEETEITGAYPDVPFTAIAIGPGVGIKACGKLLIPTWIAIGQGDMKGNNRHANSFIGVVYSADGGRKWNVKSIRVEGVESPNESMAVELSDGRVLINSRHNAEKRNRVVLESSDGVHYGNPRYDEALSEQRCMASIIATEEGILFSNPAYSDSFNGWNDRKELSVRLSEDDCKSWKYTRLVCKEWSGYSHLAAIGKEYYLLYETNLREGGAMDLVLFTFDGQWIKGEK